MDESSGGGAAAPTIVDAWLEPLPGDPVGENLEYDDDFREMEKAAAGRAATQFDEGVAPDWRQVLGRAQSLFERSRDLRVAVYWTRARLRLDGAAALPEGLRLIQGLLERYWEGLHPQPEDGDAYARVNALNELASGAALLGDLRDSVVAADRTVGEVRGRDIELVLGLLDPRADEAPPSRGAIEQMLEGIATNQPALRQFPGAAVERLDAVQQLMRDQVGYAAAPDLTPLRKVIAGLVTLVPAAGAAGGEAAAGGDAVAGEDAGGGGGGSSDAPRRGGRAGLSGSIDSRNDALRAIDMVCEYLERTEPTNPAQLLLRRARKLVNKTFIQLVKDLGPSGLEEVAKVIGLTAEELQALQSSE